MRKWLSGRASPCQGEGRGFESRLPLLYNLISRRGGMADATDSKSVSREGVGVQVPSPALLLRDVAQLGRALGLGPRSRMFKSCRPDWVYPISKESKAHGACRISNCDIIIFFRKSG